MRAHLPILRALGRTGATHTKEQQGAFMRNSRAFFVVFLGLPLINVLLTFLAYNTLKTA